MNGNTPIIQTDNLSKVYQKNRTETVTALKGLSLSVQRGEIFGYLGPNGAGKTTTIRLLLDIIRPSSGKAAIFGQDAQTNAVELHKRIGFLPGELNLWKHMTGAQVVDFVGRVRGNIDSAFIRRLTDRLQLDLNIRIRSYSTGNKRKLGIVLAMMNKPDLLILDEPTSGLDPLMQQTFNELMLEAQQAGQTVFLSSHMLGEVQAICDRVGILRGGELKAVETITSLTRANFRWVTVRVREAVAPSLLSSLNGVSEVSAVEGGLKLRLVGDFDPLLRALSPYYVQDVAVAEPTLEEIFLSFYGGNGNTQKERAS
ncbi:MAG: ABC transporter ATP-binding protein [Chloroflexi bacterium]|nr:ABC transporter ATP-binding protein [Chloroflexota bacterium]MCC6897206.1 ABC transporter ATP-binding protein [Anaerolineae bacterium]